LGLGFTNTRIRNVKEEEPFRVWGLGFTNTRIRNVKEEEPFNGC
jgi:hypothetical protein